MPLKPPSGALPMVHCSPAVWSMKLEEDQRDGERDDAEIDVADAAVEHEVAEQRGEQRRHQDGQQRRHRGVAEVDGGDRVGVAAQAEERRLAEAQDAGIAPDQRQRQSEDGEG